MRGLRTKLFDLRCAIVSSTVPYDIILLTETWLNDNIADSELGFFNYNVFRMDRNVNNSVSSRGGSVLIAVHKN